MYIVIMMEIKSIMNVIMCDKAGNLLQYTLLPLDATNVLIFLIFFTCKWLIAQIYNLI